MVYKQLRTIIRKTTGAAREHLCHAKTLSATPGRYRPTSSFEQSREEKKSMRYTGFVPKVIRGGPLPPSYSRSFRK